MANDELTKTGQPRRRRPGAGRPPKHGEETRSVRVPISIPTELVSAVPELQAILDYWEADLAANPNSERRYYARKMLDEIRALGY